MNYQKVYDLLIERAKVRGLDKKKLDGYFEKHHIIPRCMNGTNVKNNLVLLTGREHYLCHYLLYKIYKENYKIFFAFRALALLGFSDYKYIPKLSSKQFESLRIKQGSYTKERMLTYKAADETKDKLRKALTGRIINKEWRDKISISNMGKIPSLETKIKQSLSAKERHKDPAQRKTCGNGSRGRVWSEEHKQMLKEKSTGFKHSEETKRLMSEAKKGHGCPWRFKSCFIDGLKFETIKKAAEHVKLTFGIGHRKFLFMLDSKEYPNWHRE